MTNSKEYLDEAGRNAERLGAALDLYFLERGQGFNAHLLTRSQSEALARLNAKSDLELLREGLTRSDIPRHVFGPFFC